MLKFVYIYKEIKTDAYEVRDSQLELKEDSRLEYVGKVEATEENTLINEKFVWVADLTDGNYISSSSSPYETRLEAEIKIAMEIYRMAQYKRIFFPSLYLVCRECGGLGTISYRKGGKRVMRTIIKTCPTCKGKNPNM